MHKNNHFQLFLVILLALFCYSFGLPGGFFFDDHPYILRNVYVRLSEFDVSSIRNAMVSGNWPLRRPLSMLTFALNYYFDGYEPLYYKVVNIFLHLIAGVAIFWVSCLLLRACRITQDNTLSERTIRNLSLVSASIWLLHPLQVSTTLYATQRMTILSSIFVLLGTGFYVQGRLKTLNKQGRALGYMLLGLALMGSLGVSSKENGVILPLLILVVEFALLRFREATFGTRALLLTIAFAVLSVLAYSVINPDWILRGYEVRSFTPTERLLTQARLLWFYVYLIALPSIRAMAFFHDDIALSLTPFTPWTTLPAILALLASLVFALWKSKKYPIASFAILWFLTGHILESTVIGLELVFEHRNYLPSFGLIFGFVYLAHVFSDRHVRRKSITVLAIIGLLAALAGATATRAHQWSSNVRLFLYDLVRHPKSHRANYFLSLHYLDSGESAECIRYGSAAISLSKLDIGAHLSTLTCALRGQPVDYGLVKFLVADLKHRLQSGPQPLSVVTALEGFAQTESDPKEPARLSPRNLVEILEAARANKSFQERPRQAFIYHIIGMVYYSNSDPVRALEAAKKAGELDPQSVFFLLNLARIQMALGDFDAASKTLARAESNNKENLFNVQKGIDAEKAMLRQLRSGTK